MSRFTYLGPVLPEQMRWAIVQGVMTYVEARRLFLLMMAQVEADEVPDDLVPAMTRYQHWLTTMGQLQ